MQVFDEATGRCRPFQAQQVRRLPIAPELMLLVQEGMYRVVNSPNGTAYQHTRDLPVETCAKTGTAQTAPQRRGIDDNGDGRIDRWGEVVRVGNTAWFAGYAPYRRPRIAFAVVVEYSPAGGGPTCAPIAREVLNACRALGYL
jgi:penicillin-binding protein 2